MRKNMHFMWRLLTALLFTGIGSVLVGAALVSPAAAQQEPDLPEPEPLLLPLNETSADALQPEEAPFVESAPLFLTLEEPALEPLSSEEDGLFSVVVRLQMGPDYLPEGRLNNRERIEAQRAAINFSQETLLQSMRAAAVTFQSSHQYTTIPYVALTVDAAGLALLENDPLVASIAQDGLNALQTFRSNPVVQAPEAWAAGYTGEGYAVAIIDTGVDRNHPVFADGKIVEEACYGSARDGFLPACPGGVTELIGPGAAAPGDCVGCYHGTHVSGIAAGNGDDISDIYGLLEPTPFRGIAPDADIIAVNTFSIRQSSRQPGAFDSDVIAGLEYVYRLAVDGPDGIPANGDEIQIAAANMSLGAGIRYTEVCDGETDPGYVAIVDQLASQNIATIAASGNQGFKDGIGLPACYSNIISVGASTVEASDPSFLAGADGTVAYFSNSSELLDLLAPGFFVTSSVPVGTGPISEDYRRLQGTSMSSPYVAGAWAIMRQRFPGASPTDILRQLQLTGLPITDNGQRVGGTSYAGNGLTHPLIQMRDAIELAEPVIISPLTITFNLRPTFTWQQMPVTDSYDVTVYRADDNTVVAAAANLVCPRDPCGVVSGVTLLNDTNYYWTVQGKNDLGYLSPVARADFVIRGASPDGDTITDTPDFVFESLDPMVVSYQLQVIDRDNDDSLVIEGTFTASDVCDGVICRINPQQNLAQAVGDRSFAWRVRGGFTTGFTDWTDYKDFTVLAPQILNIDNATAADLGRLVFTIPRLRGGGFEADWYRFYLIEAATGDVVLDEWINREDASCNSTSCAFIPDVTLYNGDYTAYVNAYAVDAGRSAWSQPFNVNMAAGAPAVNSLELRALYDENLLGLTTTDILLPCATDTDDRPVCSSARPTLEIAYNIDTFSGEWLEVVLYDPVNDTVPYAEWFNTRQDTNVNITCDDPQPLTATVRPGRCRVKSPDYLPNGRYTWYVRSYGPGGTSTGGIAGYTQPGGAGDPNNIADFRIDTPGAPIVNLTTVQQVASRPTYGLTGTFVPGEVEFSWQHEPSAVWYNLQIEDSSGVIHDQWYQVGSHLTCDGLCRLVLDDTFFPNGTYNWRVLYWNGTISQPSSSASFTMDYAQPVLVAQADLQVFLNETIEGNTRARYRWPHMENAIWYEFILQDSSGSRIYSDWLRAINICDTEGCTAWPSVNLEAGAFNWYVRPWGPGGFITSGADRSGPANFITASTATGVPAPLTPTGQTLNSSAPVFYFEPADNASWYQIIVLNSATNETTLDAWFYLPQADCSPDAEGTPTCIIRPGVEMANGDYAWYIRGYGAAGLGDWASVFGGLDWPFSIDAPISRLTTLRAPINESLATENTPTLEWDDVGAAWYGVRILNQDEEEVFYTWYPVNQVSCDGALCRLTLPTETLSSGRYTWSVATWLPANGDEIRFSETAVFIKL